MNARPAQDESEQRKTHDVLLEPERIKRQLILTSLYLTGFELLKSSIVNDVKSFFDAGFPDLVPSPNYQSKVLSKHEKVYMASCLWLAEVGAIDAEDVDVLQEIRMHRDLNAHSLPSILLDSNVNFDAALLVQMKGYISKIGKFWGRVELEISADAIDGEIDYGAIQSGRELLFDYLLSVADQENH